MSKFRITLDIMLIVLVCGLLYTSLVPKDNIFSKIYEYKESELIKSDILGTGSMLPSMIPTSQLNMIKFTNDSLLCGHVYVYRKDENSSVVHRFIYEDNEGKLYFKGDNNNAWDKPITIENIKYEVVGFDFE